MQGIRLQPGRAYTVGSLLVEEYMMHIELVLALIGAAMLFVGLTGGGILSKYVSVLKDLSEVQSKRLTWAGVALIAIGFIAHASH